MRLIDFMREFPDEQSCECKRCRYRQSPKANTVMHGSQLPLRYWFITMHLLTSTKKSFSASELQRQLGHRNYMPIWAMLHKLRNAMGKRDARYTVSGMVELDDGFFSTETPESEKDKPLKRGRGSQKKTKVLVLAEVAEGNPVRPSDKPTKVKHIKMIVIDDLKSETVDREGDGEEHTVTLRQGETVLIPATAAAIEFRPDGAMTCLASCIE